MAFAKACRGRTSVAPPMNGDTGSWLWMSDSGPPLVPIESPPSYRIPVPRGLTGTRQRTCVPVVHGAVPVARFEARLSAMPARIVSPAHAPTANAQASPLAATPSPRMSVDPAGKVVAGAGLYGSAS